MTNKYLYGNLIIIFRKIDIENLSTIFPLSVYVATQAYHERKGYLASLAINNFAASTASLFRALFDVFSFLSLLLVPHCVTKSLGAQIRKGIVLACDFISK